MARQYNDDDISDFASLMRAQNSINSGYTPQQRMASNIVQNDISSPMGILTKGLAGIIMGRQQPQTDFSQLVDYRMQKDQERMATGKRIADILKSHEEQGFGDDFSEKVMLQEYARTGDQTYLDIAKQLKPSGKSGGQYDDVSKLVSMRANYVKGKYGDPAFADNDAMAKDPTLLWIDSQMSNSMGSGKQAQGTDPKSFADLASSEPRLEMPSPSGGKPNFLPQEERIKQNKMQASGKTSNANKYEKMISANMARYGKGRAETIRALRKKGLIE